MTDIVLVEDHTLVRQSLVRCVSAETAFRVVGDAGSSEEALELVQTHEPDVVLLDVALGTEDGLELAARITKVVPGVRVLFLTMHDDDATLRGAVAVGADGFVPKTASTDELLYALRVVAEGGSYLSPTVARRVMDLASGRSTGGATGLTDRELEVLRLLAHGSRVGEVAERLFLSVKTVKNHLTNVYAKLGVATGAQAVAEAYRRGLVTSTHQPPTD